MITIIGILAGVVGLNFVGANHSRQLETEAKRLTALIELARTEALYRNESWGLLVDKEKYAFALFDDDSGTWKISDDPTFRARRLGLDMSLIVSTDVFSQSRFNFNEENKTDVLPVIHIFASGEQTPFTIKLVSTASSVSWFVRSDGIQRTQALQALEKI